MTNRTALPRQLADLDDAARVVAALEFLVRGDCGDLAFSACVLDAELLVTACDHGHGQSRTFAIPVAALREVIEPVARSNWTGGGIHIGGTGSGKTSAAAIAAAQLRAARAQSTNP